MEEETTILTPEETVASRAIAKLVERGLVREDKVKEIELKLATGNATVEDWRNEVDLATAPEEDEQQD